MDEEASSQSLASILVPLFTIGLVVFVQVNFWLSSAPASEEHQEEDKAETAKGAKEQQVRDGEATPENGRLSKEATANDVQTISLSKSMEKDKRSTSSPSTTNTKTKGTNETAITMEGVKGGGEKEDGGDDKDLFQMNTSQWRCVCEEGSFLPPSLLKAFGPAEAMVRLGTGQCYHKQA